MRQAAPPGTAPCDRRSAGSPGSAPAAPSLYGGGSGPGDYGRYIPGAAPPADTAAKKPDATAPQPVASRAVAADRPLYGGTDRPLWDTGERRATASATGKPPAAGEAGSDASSTTTPAQPNALPAPVRDRPLWAQSGLSGAAAPATGSDLGPSSGFAGIAPAPCATAPGSQPPR